MFKNVLITGIAGSGGSYLAEHISSKNIELKTHGLIRSSSKNIARIKNIAQLHECDMNDYESLKNAITQINPDIIFNLASNADVLASWQTPIPILHNNITSTANLLEAIRILKSNPILVHCSTSEVYGQVDPKFVPITEDCPLNPASPYAISKLTQDLLVQSYYKAYGIKAIRTRMFSYVNPRRANLVQTAFALQIARIELGLQKELTHGNLESVRTWLDVRDCVEAYWQAGCKCMPGEAYNMGGTKTVKIGELLDILKSKAKCHIPTRLDPKLVRPFDVTLQIPSTEKFTVQTGWKPQYTFDESIDFLLDDCRRQIREEQS